MIDHPDRKPSQDSALVLLSGGQDSTTCLYWAMHTYDHVEALSFDYGQRHHVELVVAKQIAHEAGVARTVLDVPALSQIGAASLTNEDIPSAMDAEGTGNVYAAEHDLPSSFVPGRNAVLLSTAVAFAAPRGIYNIVIGVCEADDAGYPDCRHSFVQVMEVALQVALDDRRLTLVAPLLHLDKARTFALAERVGGLDAVLELSHTCYNGAHASTDRHPWGYGCGECPSCQTRAKGYAEYTGAPTW